MKQFLKIVFASMVGFLLANTILTVGSLVLVGLFFGMLASSTTQVSDVVTDSEPKVLYLELAGPIIERHRHQDFHFGEEVPFLEESMALSLYDLQKVLKQAADDEKIKGLFIDAKYVEAGPATLKSLRRSLQEFSEAQKFIYAYSDLYDESSYYLASVADAIFMYPQGDFELDGFASIPTFFKESLEKLEIEPVIYRAGAYKSAVEPFIREDLSDENREQIRVLLDGLWQVFLDEVSVARKMSKEELSELATEMKVTSAESAKVHRLVDELKYQDEVMTFLRGAMGIVDEEEDVPLVSVRSYSRMKSSGGDPARFIGISSQSDSESDEDQVAIVFAEGEIVLGESDERFMGSETIMEALREAREDENVKAVVLRVDSPGGSALASDQIWREVVLTNEKKPVIASMADIAASGGYYISAGAKEIFAESNTITGSIGVFGLTFVMKDFFKNKLGMSFDRVVTHPFADIGNSSRSPTEQEVSMVNREVDRVYQRFLTVVDEGREQLSRYQLLEVAEGRVWTGADAQKVKLVDQLGGLQQAVARAAELAQLDDDYEIQILPRPENPLKFVFNFMSSKVSEAVSGQPIWLRDMQRRFGWKSLNVPAEKAQILTLMPLQIQID